MLADFVILCDNKSTKSPFLFDNRRDYDMARSVNYAAKIEKLEEKISKKKAELDRLQEELKVLKQKKDEHDYGALLDYMKENNLSAEQVLTSIKPEERVAQS